MQRWREATVEDEELLKRLFSEHAAGELQGLAEACVDVAALIEMQRRGREKSYAVAYPAAQDWILLDEQGEAVGRLLLHCGERHWRVVDVAILAAKRGRGLGSAVLREWLEKAAALGVDITLQTRPWNPARRLYERLGFRSFAENELAVEMIWPPTPTRREAKEGIREDYEH